MAAKKLNLLGDNDKAQYRAMIADEIKTGTLSADVHISQINQLVDMSPDLNYLGAWLALDGPMVTHSYGPEPAYRKWLFVDADWNVKIFDSIRTAFIHIATNVAPLFHFKPYYSNGDDFELSGVQQYGTYNLDKYAGKTE